jgi:hypothetical protein
VAKVSLDGLRIEVPHQTDPAELAQRLAEFAEDLAENKFADWGVQISDRGNGGFNLTGRKDGTHFDAKVSSDHGVAVIDLTGSIELGRIMLGLAGGAEGVRRRVTDTLAETLREHLT